ncbi:MAG: hypothetical protein Q9184_007318, partial [Pyrenodesmia sp. 2 TL-2023]
MDPTVEAERKTSPVSQFSCCEVRTSNLEKGLPYEIMLTRFSIHQNDETSIQYEDTWSQLKSSTSSHAPHRCFFMELPPEIRVLIYDYCLMVAGEIIPYPSLGEQYRTRMFVPNEKPTVALVQLSRQIHHEALPSLYSKNLWRLSYQTDPLLPRTIWDNERNRHLLRHVSVHFDQRDVTQRSHDAIVSHFAPNVQESEQSSPVDILRREKDIKSFQKAFFL